MGLIEISETGGDSRPGERPRYLAIASGMNRPLKSLYGLNRSPGIRPLAVRAAVETWEFRCDRDRSARLTRGVHCFSES